MDKQMASGNSSVKNERGSALIMVLFALVILSLLGTVVVNSTLLDLRLVISEGRNDISYYRAESGLDELKEAIEQRIMLLHETASRRAGSEFDDEMAKAKAHYEAYQSYAKSVYLSGLNEEYQALRPIDINENKFFEANGALKRRADLGRTEAELWVRERYAQLFAGGVNTMFSVSTEADDDGWRRLTLVGSEDEVMALGLNDGGLNSGGVGFYVKNGLALFEPAWLSEDDFAVIPVTARFTPSKLLYGEGRNSVYDPASIGGATAEISVRIVISIPKFDPKVVVSQSLYTVQPNVLWTKALAAAGSITAEGEASVSGNVYAEGAGGVIVGGSDRELTSLTVNGQLATGASVRISTANSRLSVSGTVYANSIGIDAGVTNLTTAMDSDYHIIIGGAVVKDDMELSGANSRVLVNGSYYGFSDTPDSSGRGSSGIVIADAAGLVRKGATRLTINGDLLLAGVNTGAGGGKNSESLSVLGNAPAEESFIKVGGSIISAGSVSANGVIYGKSELTLEVERLKREKAGEFEVETARLGNYEGEVTSITGQFDFSAGGMDDVFVFDGKGRSVELLIVRENDGSPLIVNGAMIVAAAVRNGMSETEAEAYRGAVLEGLIISGGDIILDSVTVRGSVISGSNITLRGRVTVVNDISQVLRAMYHNETLAKRFVQAEKVVAGPFSGASAKPLYNLGAQTLGFDSDAYIYEGGVNNAIAEEAVQFIEWTIVR